MIFGRTPPFTPQIFRKTRFGEKKQEKKENFSKGRWKTGGGVEKCAGAEKCEKKSKSGNDRIFSGGLFLKCIFFRRKIFEKRITTKSFFSPKGEILEVKAPKRSRMPRFLTLWKTCRKPRKSWKTCGKPWGHPVGTRQGDTFLESVPLHPPQNISNKRKAIPGPLRTPSSTAANRLPRCPGFTRPKFGVSCAKILKGVQCREGTSLRAPRVTCR